MRNHLMAAEMPTQMTAEPVAISMIKPAVQQAADEAQALQGSEV